MATPKTKNSEPEFDWIQLKKDISSGQIEETQKEKLIRKINENPLVPIGTFNFRNPILFEKQF